MSSALKECFRFPSFWMLRSVVSVHRGAVFSQTLSALSRLGRAVTAADVVSFDRTVVLASAVLELATRFSYATVPTTQLFGISAASRTHQRQYFNDVILERGLNAEQSRRVHPLDTERQLPVLERCID